MVALFIVYIGLPRRQRDADSLSQRRRQIRGSAKQEACRPRLTYMGSVGRNRFPQFYGRHARPAQACWPVLRAKDPDDAASYRKKGAGRLLWDPDDLLRGSQSYRGGFSTERRFDE